MRVSSPVSASGEGHRLLRHRPAARGEGTRSPRRLHQADADRRQLGNAEGCWRNEGTHALFTRRSAGLAPPTSPFEPTMANQSANVGTVTTDAPPPGLEKYTGDTSFFGHPRGLS